MLTRALLVLLAMMTGLAAGPAQTAARIPHSTVSISVQAGHVDAARAEAFVPAHAHLAARWTAHEPEQKPDRGCELTAGRTVERGDRARE